MSEPGTANFKRVHGFSGAPTVLLAHGNESVKTEGNNAAREAYHNANWRINQQNGVSEESWKGILDNQFGAKETTLGKIKKLDYNKLFFQRQLAEGSLQELMKKKFISPAPKSEKAIKGRRVLNNGRENIPPNQKIDGTVEGELISPPPAEDNASSTGDQ